MYRHQTEVKDGLEWLLIYVYPLHLCLTTSPSSAQLHNNLGKGAVGTISVVSRGVNLRTERTDCSLLSRNSMVGNSLTYIPYIDALPATSSQKGRRKHIARRYRHSLDAVNPLARQGWPISVGRHPAACFRRRLSDHPIKRTLPYIQLDGGVFPGLTDTSRESSILMLFLTANSPRISQRFAGAVT